MKFLLYSLNYAPELTGIGKYNGELAIDLVARGIKTDIITGAPYYPEWAVHKGFKNAYTATLSENSVNIYRCPLYVPAEVTTVKRLFHLSSFAISSGVRLFSLWRTKPDVLLLVQPTLFCAPIALIFCKLTGAKSIMHIQDFEVDAMFGLGMGGARKFKRFACAVESWILKRFDVVSSISYSMLENARLKGVAEDRLMFFPNWADTNFVTPDNDGSALKKEWGFNQDDKIVLYAGNIGKKQGLEIVLSAAQAMQSRSDVHFMLVGSGAHCDDLQADAAERKLTNVHFKPLQPWARVPEMLALADIHLVVQKKGAADAVLPSKLTNILSSGGHALVTAESHTELGVIAERFPGIYTCVEPEDEQLFTVALQQLLNNDLRSTNQIARDYALEYLSKETVLSRFEQDLQQLCGREAK
ncbi:WcaI family glycosyltransferase [Neptunomonas qingdaonensis]|uniref:Colanic acid biosynthesis glycosyl transferase WcaI n=1 Tax=Neptunomonas qingdaonensis TaxID=1045558 RepID=A0A1I2VS43_9GAMM|nr:WcaI family glycosyltransferase [Neptunomonas qingdaonensis]SFG92145.1 colanic acid biosynthesis glycosyl transferase WcaI [Neptunomonas qingdaonensis]